MLKILWALILLFIGTTSFPGETPKESQTGRPEPQSHYILIDAGKDKRVNYYRYYNEILEGYETLLALGRQVKILAKDGTWQLTPQKNELLLQPKRPEALALSLPGDNKIPNYPPISSLSGRKTDLMNALQGLSPQRGDKVVLIFSGHGRPPNDPNDPGSAGFDLWNQRLTWNEFAEIINDNPQYNFLALSGICYGGGIHEVALKTDNFCSAANSTFFFPSSSPVEGGRFIRNIWQQLRRDGRDLSFGEAALKSLAADILNQGGQLSSFYFMDKVLSKGVFQDQIHTSPVVGHWFMDPNTGKKLWKYDLPDTFEPFFPNPKLEPRPCSYEEKDPTQFLADLAQDLADILDQAVSDSQNPPENRRKNRNVAKEIKNLYTQLHIKYQKKLLSFQAGEGNQGRGRPNGQSLSLYDDPEPDAGEELYIYEQILQRLKKMENFLGVANDSQKQKLFKLLKCEGRNL